MAEKITAISNFCNDDIIMYESAAGWIFAVVKNFDRNTNVVTLQRGFDIIEMDPINLQSAMNAYKISVEELVREINRTNPSMPHWFGA